MSNIRIKFYEGGTAGTGGKAYNGNTTDATLNHVIQGDLIRYKIVDNSNYLVDTAWFRVDASNDYDGSTRKYNISNGDIWRAFNLRGNLISSGYVTSTSENDGRLEIRSEGWTGILKRRVVNGEEYENTDIDDIVKDLLDSYFEVSNSDYNISQANIDATSNALSVKYDGITVYDAVRDLSERAYGSNSLPFDFYIYESSVGSLAMEFFERGDRPSSGKKTLTSSDFQPNTFTFNRRDDLNFNSVRVYGDFKKVNLVPTDMDYWTEFDNDVDVQAIWSTTSDVNVGTSARDITGSYSINADMDSGANGGDYIRLDLTDADAYDSGKTPSELFTSGSGYHIVNTKNQYLQFYIYVDEDMATDINADDAILYLVALTETSGSYPQVGVMGYGGSDVTNMGHNKYPVTGGQWYKYDIPLTDLVEVDADYVDSLYFHCDYLGGATAGGSEEYYVDGLHFYEKASEKVTGTYPASPTAPINEIVIHDQSVKSSWMAEDLATSIYNAYYEQWSGGGRLNRYISGLKAGDDIEFLDPQRGINVSDLTVQQIIYEPYNTVLKLGRHKSLNEIITQQKTEVRRRV